MNKILSILFCFVSIVASAQTATVKGLIKDELSQKVLDTATEDIL